MTTVHRKGHRTSGQSKVDRGYTRPLITDLVTISGSGVVVGAYGSTTPNFTPTSGAAWALDSDSGNVWAYFNVAWHFSGITINP